MTISRFPVYSKPMAGVIVLTCRRHRNHRSSFGIAGPSSQKHSTFSKFSPSSSTYPRELDAAVAALGGSAALLDVEETKLAAGGLDNPRQVRRGVVAIARPKLAKFPSAFLSFPVSAHYHVHSNG